MQTIRDGYRQRANFIGDHSAAGAGQITVNVRDLLAFLDDADELEKIRDLQRALMGNRPIDRVAIERFGVQLANARIDRMQLWSGWARSTMNETAPRPRTLDLYRPENMPGHVWGQQILDGLSMFKQAEPVRADPEHWPPPASPE